MLLVTDHNQHAFASIGTRSFSGNFRSRFRPPLNKKNVFSVHWPAEMIARWSAGKSFFLIFVLITKGLLKSYFYNMTKIT